jgi:hypothetical protein
MVVAVLLGRDLRVMDRVTGRLLVGDVAGVSGCDVTVDMPCGELAFSGYDIGGSSFTDCGSDARVLIHSSNMVRLSSDMSSKSSHILSNSNLTGFL